MWEKRVKARLVIVWTRRIGSGRRYHVVLYDVQWRHSSEAPPAHWISHCPRTSLSIWPVYYRYATVQGQENSKVASQPFWVRLPAILSGTRRIFKVILWFICPKWERQLDKYVFELRKTNEISPTSNVVVRQRVRLEREHQQQVDYLIWLRIVTRLWPMLPDPKTCTTPISCTEGVQTERQPCSSASDCSVWLPTCSVAVYPFKLGRQSAAAESKCFPAQ